MELFAAAASFSAQDVLLL